MDVGVCDSCFYTSMKFEGKSHSDRISFWCLIFYFLKHLYHYLAWMWMCWRAQTSANPFTRFWYPISLGLPGLKKGGGGLHQRNASWFWPVAVMADAFTQGVLVTGSMQKVTLIAKWIPAVGKMKVVWPRLVTGRLVKRGKQENRLLPHFKIPWLDWLQTYCITQIESINRPLQGWKPVPLWSVCFACSVSGCSSVSFHCLSIILSSTPLFLSIKGKLAVCAHITHTSGAGDGLREPMSLTVHYLLSIKLVPTVDSYSFHPGTKQHLQVLTAEKPIKNEHY